MNSISPTGAPHPVDLHVGRKIKARRNELNMSLATLGTAIGVTFQQVGKYERAQNRVSASVLVELAAVLAVNPGYFIDDAPGAAAAPLRDDWQEATELFVSVNRMIDAMRYLAQMTPPEQMIAINSLAMMSGLFHSRTA